MSIALPVLLIPALGIAAYFVFCSDDKDGITTPSIGASTFTPHNVTRKAKALDDLLAMRAGQIADVDIAEMNLLCATGLPGAENLDIDGSLAKLDQWAVRVRSATKRHLYRAHDPRWADHYKHSEDWLRAEFLAQVLQEDCGVRYNMERIRNIDFRNAKDLFIHGMIGNENGGTCASMPVLYVAVGRRLGYPLKLVLTKGHVFARWDGADGTFNIETTGDGGTDSYPDEYYGTWPLKWTPQEKKASRYLISLSPAEELASFLASRAHCLLDNGRTREALDAYSAARRLAPKDPTYLAWARQAERRVRPPALAGPTGFRPPSRPHRDPMLDVERINAMNRASMRRMMQPPRPGAPGAPWPQAAQAGVSRPSEPIQPAQPPKP